MQSIEGVARRACEARIGRGRRRDEGFGDLGMRRAEPAERGGRGTPDARIGVLCHLLRGALRGRVPVHQVARGCGDECGECCKSDGRLGVAERIGTPSLISEELAFERWDAMVRNAR